MLELIDQTEVAAALKGACVAIGNFDGLHLGHQALKLPEKPGHRPAW